MGNNWLSNFSFLSILFLLPSFFCLCFTKVNNCFWMCANSILFSFCYTLQQTYFFSTVSFLTLSLHTLFHNIYQYVPGHQFYISSGERCYLWDTKHTLTSFKYYNYTRHKIQANMNQQFCFTLFYMFLKTWLRSIVLTKFKIDKLKFDSSCF